MFYLKEIEVIIAIFRPELLSSLKALPQKLLKVVFPAYTHQFPEKPEGWLEKYGNDRGTHKLNKMWVTGV